MSIQSVEIANCHVCGKRCPTAISLPKLPFTGLFSDRFDPHFPTHDQEFLYCGACGHGQLRYLISPDFLYGSSYGFRTSKSATASGGSVFFAKFLRELFPNRRFPKILEFGCNDGFLLKLIEDLGDTLLGIDSSIDSIQLTPKVNIREGRIEHVDFQSYLGGCPNLVLSQHTLEHIENPRNLLENLLARVEQETIFVLEFPCFDPLYRKNRFDQIFHQHLHYFTLHSFSKLLSQLGCEMIRYAFNFNYWGALIVAFQKRPATRHRNTPDSTVPFPTLREVRGGYRLFSNQMAISAKLLEKVVKEGETVYGYGAALMLSLLGYHLKTDFSFLKGVFDDDQERTGQMYRNLPLGVESPQGVDFESLTILLTAMDNRRPIMKKLVDLKPKMILNPLIMC